ncbi:MAG: phenylalanyl-tRNA synthetase alpha chain [Candidatus Saganbacteria bacterium]|uniref:Phenylalanine--tRNA ligase alpha subunit n=1 Tax=Candidatus Saganbacteria bacterium TaxID=2575572 RepID=A0A833L2K6_UNCSA|nr:MAG: phenylalanyl-tRNA synthetase alpha chain [Candidatus Saganbacteria bacterium]
MVERIRAIENEALENITNAKSLSDIDDAQIRYLGKKGLLTELMRNLKILPEEERRNFGKALNETKIKIEGLIASRKAQFSAQLTQNKINSEVLDITLPGKFIKRGKLHPITQVMDEMIGIFIRMGFSIAEGPDIETEYYNFEALNIPKYHPSRDMWSTLWINNELLLRTHTSPVQIRVMEKQKPPLAIIAPGRVYRRDSDVTHSPVFHQLEGLLVDKKITFGDLKGTLSYFLRQVFGKEKKVRFRPSYFPFTEPSAEVDVECVLCNGAGCRLCKNTGWLEILGSGMVDPNVFKFVGYNSEKFSGYAFGMGIERIAMLKFGIDDIRLFFENDLRFLEQF